MGEGAQSVARKSGSRVRWREFEEGNPRRHQGIYQQGLDLTKSSKQPTRPYPIQEPTATQTQKTPACCEPSLTQEGPMTPKHITIEERQKRDPTVQCPRATRV